MNGTKKQDSIEVSSSTLKSELTAIKDRLSAIETIESISNKSVVKAFVEEHLTTSQGKRIMQECEQPRTRQYLKSKFGFNSPPALDYHLKPLREADLLRENVSDDGSVTFEWSNLFRRLPRSTLNKIMGVSAKS